jgi:hypothetical protein
MPVTALRGLSQLSTSFIASWCQGIHRKPLVALKISDGFSQLKITESHLYGTTYKIEPVLDGLKSLEFEFGTTSISKIAEAILRTIYVVTKL